MSAMPPRLLRPKDESGVPDGSDSPPERKSSRRKAVSSACVPCRKRKSKCDGSLPACSTCTAVYRTECFYDADNDHRRKGILQRDMSSLQERYDYLDVIVTSLRSLPESEAMSIMHSLRSEGGLNDIAASLQTNVRLPSSLAPQTLEADFAEQLRHTPNSSRTDSRGSEVSRQNSGDNRRPTNSATTAGAHTHWFSSPQDLGFVEHLLSLYFCWIHPFYHLLSRDLFLYDMDRNGTEFCSTMLVNALLSFACHYSDRLEAYQDPEDSSTAGDHFFAEAKRLLDESESPSLTTVQALGIMSLRETSCGRDSNGYQYAGRCVRMALEIGLHISSVGSGLRPSAIEVRKITFFAVFNLETLCSITVGRLSQLPRAGADVPKPVATDFTEQVWQPYVDDNVLVVPLPEKPPSSMLFLDSLDKLSELASSVVGTFYASPERLTSRRLASTYAHYQDWYNKLPTELRLHSGSVPHVVVLHMYYYGCVLHLFRPYIKLDLRDANLFPHEACTFCANQISALMDSLRGTYGLRRVPLQTVSLLLSASTIHLLNLPSEPAATHLSQGLEDLQAISSNHAFAARCVEILQALATKWNIVLPERATAVAMFGAHGNQSWPSPTTSSFWAASIPRKKSSPAGIATASTFNHQYPPFQRSPLPQGQNPFPPVFANTSTQADTSPAQNAFWTPFPVQTMPMPPSFASSMADYSSFDHGQASWAPSDMLATTPSILLSTDTQLSDSRFTDDTMNYGDWQWRGS